MLFLVLVFVIVKRKEYISSFDLYHFSLSPESKLFNFVIWKIVTMTNDIVDLR